VGNRHGQEGLAPTRVCTHSAEGTEAHHGGRKGSRQQPALRCRSTNRQTAVSLRDARGIRGVRGARGVLDGLWNREPRRAAVELICAGVMNDEEALRRDVGRSETTSVSRQAVEVVEGLQCCDVVSCGAGDAMRIQMAQCRRRTRSRTNYRWTWASIRMGFWMSGELLLDRLAPCPILNYGC